MPRLSRSSWLAIAQGTDARGLLPLSLGTSGQPDYPLSGPVRALPRSPGSFHELFESLPDLHMKSFDSRAIGLPQ